MVEASKWVVAGFEIDNLTGPFGIKRLFYMDLLNNRVYDISQAYFYDDEQTAQIYCDMSQDNVRPLKVNLVYSLELAV